MSSSPSPELLPAPLPVAPAAAAPQSGPLRGSDREVLPFCYGEVSPGAALGFPPPGGDAARSNREAVDREARARALGRQEGEQQGRAHFEEQLALARAGVAAAISEFARERGAYYQKLEEEVVKLALGIARQILHREAQMDPLLLAGIVRVALEKIEGATGVTLLVNPGNAADWRHYLSTRMEPADLPEIVEDSAIEPDRCTIRTAMGTAELGLEVQLKEIEQGLMDLLAARPPGNA